MISDLVSVLNSELVDLIPLSPATLHGPCNMNVEVGDRLLGRHTIVLPNADTRSTICLIDGRSNTAGQVHDCVGFGVMKVKNGGNVPNWDHKDVRNTPLFAGHEYRR